MHKKLGYNCMTFVIAVTTEDDDDCHTNNLKVDSRVRDKDPVSLLSDHMAMHNKWASRPDKDMWPPHMSKHFVPLVMVYHKGEQPRDQTVEIARMGDINSAREQLIHTGSKHGNQVLTTDIIDIIYPLEKDDEPQFVVIDGAPGIGKSALLKEIALRWSNKKLLQSFKFVLLLCLRDPIVQQAKSVIDLLRLFCKGNPRGEDIITVGNHYLFENSGKDVIFLFDGFDELPENLQYDSLIVDIINRQFLPLCGIVISSRPHASINLRKRATVKVDILGFTENERKHYIEQTLKGQQEDISNLTQYLDNHVTISNVCAIPYNMEILLFLWNEGLTNLTDCSTELYNHFIRLTVCWHIAKSGTLLHSKITSLTDLPAPYKSIIKQLSKLALDSLDSQKLVFTFDEIKMACPEIEDVPGALNGFGLLQAVKYPSLYGNTMIFNFLHLSTQEYLGVHYIITYLPPDEEFHLLCKKFHSNIHANMFSMYVTLTKGQRSSFKKFLSGGDDTIPISENFLCNQLQCIYLFHCFYEAGDSSMCKFIEDAAIFSAKEINLSNYRLSLNDIVHISVFLTSSSHMEWELLNLECCFIQDCGIQIFHELLKGGKVTINMLQLPYNGLTKLSASYISGITLSCKVKRLSLRHNISVGEDEQLYTMLSHPSSLLTYLNMCYTSLSSLSAKELFTAMKNSDKMQCLFVNSNDIDDEAVDTIATTVKHHTSLHALWIWDNPISIKAMQVILEALQTNDTLEILWVSFYNRAVRRGMKSIKKKINEARRKNKAKPLDLNFHTPDL